MVHWLMRVAQTLFWTFWMMSPLPVELAQPTLRLLADLPARIAPALHKGDPFAH